MVDPKHLKVPEDEARDLGLLEEGILKLDQIFVE
jgi:hypothetical protein